MKTLNEIIEEFKIKSSDFINGRLSPLAFDEWFLKTLKASREEALEEIKKEAFKKIEQRIANTPEYKDEKGKIDWFQGDAYMDALHDIAKDFESI